MIHVCFSLHDKTGRYSKFTGTAMLSLFENVITPRSTTVHILHDNTLTEDNREKFIYLAGRCNQFVEFHNIEKLLKDKLQEYVNLFPAIKDSRVTVAGFYRLLIPQLFSSEINKVIYLDSDIIVNLDINELWQIKLQDKALAAVPEVEIVNAPSNISIRYLVTSNLVTQEDYFNSGVLVMDLKNLRQSEERIIDGIIWRNEHTQCEYFDQDILNYVFSKDYLKLDEKFDRFISKARNSNKDYDAIYHYIGDTLQTDISDPFNRLWFDYFCKTPWFDVSVIGNLHKYINEFNQILGQERKNSLIKFSAALSGKKRVFVVKDKKNINWLKKTYSIRDNEEIFVIEDEESLPQLIEEMKTSLDKKLFLIRARELIRPLKEAGFVEEKDFFNHQVLFSSNLLSKKHRLSLINMI